MTLIVENQLDNHFTSNSEFFLHQISDQHVDCWILTDTFFERELSKFKFVISDFKIHLQRCV